MPSRELVFVYGTLMRDHENHAVLVELEARRRGDAHTTEARLLVDLGPYPALLLSAEGTCVVHGELYELDEPALASLDDFEGAPDLYVRARISVRSGGEEFEAWTYALAGPSPPNAAVLATGRYVTLDKKP